MPNGTKIANAAFSIEFNPPVAGVKLATLSITSDDADEPDFDFELKGTALADPPEILAVDIPTDGTYTVGDVLILTLTYDEIVNITAPNPILSITFDSDTKGATFLDGNGTTQLRFSYTITDDDQDDADGILLVSPIDLNGGTMKDAIGNPAQITLTTPANSIEVDTQGPQITGIELPPADTYIIGESMVFSMTFDEATTITGTPHLTLDLDGTSAIASFIGMSGGKARFEYIVQDGDYDGDGVGFTSPLLLNGGTIRDNLGNDATLTFTLPDALGVQVDARLPEVASVAVPSDDIYIPGDVMTFTVTYNKTVDILGGTPSFEVNIGGVMRPVTYASGTGTDELIFTYTVQNGDKDPNGVELGTDIVLNGGTIEDAVGNSAGLALNNPASTTGVKVDGVPPSVLSVDVPADGTYLVGQAITLTVTFDENVDVTGIPSIGITIGGKPVTADMTSHVGSVLKFTYIVESGDDDGGTGISVNTSISLGTSTITDLGGNNADTNIGSPVTSGILVDGVAPDILSVDVPTDGTYKVGDVLIFTITYDEAVNITAPNPILSITFDSGTKGATFLDGDGSTQLRFSYTITQGDVDGGGIALVPTIDLNGGTMKDAIGNPAQVTFTPPAGNSIVIDGAVPTVLNVTSTAANATYETAGVTIPVTVEFNDIVNVTTGGGIPRLQLETGSTDQYAVYVGGTGTTILTFNYTIMDGDGSNDLNYVATTSLELNGGTIKDGSGNNATLTLPGLTAVGSLGTNKDIVIQTGIIWNGTTWIPSPPGTNDPVIVQGDMTIDSPLEVGDLTIGAGTTLTVNPNETLTVNGDLTNNGTLILKAGTPLDVTGSLITEGAITNNGIMKAELFISGGTDIHWVSSPFTDCDHTVFSGAAYFKQHGINYIDYGGGNWWYEDVWTNPYTGTLEPAESFFAAFQQDKVVTFVANPGETFNCNPSYSPPFYNSVSYWGYNATIPSYFGNPYPSAIDFHDLNVSGFNNTVYFRKGIKNVYWNDGLGTGVGTTSGIIPAMQGFMLQTTALTNTISIPSTARTHETTPYYKSGSAADILRLKLTEVNANETGECIVALHPEANMAFDNEYDSYKLFDENSKQPDLFTRSTDDRQLIMNALSEMELPVTIPLFAQSKAAGKLTIQSEGQLPCHVYLEDKLTGNYTDLSVNDYQFDNMNTKNNRFVLHLTLDATLLDVMNAEPIRIYSHDHSIYVQLPNILTDATIEVFDLTGRRIVSTNSADKLTRIEMQKAGMYLVKIQTQRGSTIEKVFVR